MATKKVQSLKIADIRMELAANPAAGSGTFFSIVAAQSAPFALVGLIANGHNYLVKSIPVQPGQRVVSVPLTPPPPSGSVIWWAVLAGTNIPGLSAVLGGVGPARLLGRTGSVARAGVWSGSSVV